MATYDYFCQDCGRLFEVRMNMSEYSAGAKPRCPNCRSDHVVRTFTSFNVLARRTERPVPLGGCGPASSTGCCR